MFINFFIQYFILFINWFLFTSIYIYIILLRARDAALGFPGLKRTLVVLFN